ncbi:MAG: 1-(5-phosphoribosyl)-5-[(5-phosphoribosylamino)methylideneamino] imidazole-4-carboxamide isomerase [Ignavibacteriales bacterium]|nr:1-(5-phosphoribosyl)-5-[(5-phosphoribosylamino)methylideneamino] imidazole-4-carboxamide isomerase [Ignavibacteriales bacterium]
MTPTLLVIPSIDIHDGKTVRTVRGIPELDCKGYGDDPVEMARIWRAENAKLLHIVDYDGSRDPSRKNLRVVREIVEAVIIPVVYSGGVRNFEDARALIDAGVYRLALGTMTVKASAEFERTLDEFGPRKICAALDVEGDKIVVGGRTERTDIDAIDHARRLAEAGVERFVVTDVERNGSLEGPNCDLAKRVADASGKRVTLSGGARNKDELMDVQRLAEFGVDSLIVGRALYENRFPCQKLWRVAEAGVFA